jgi:futalosine hydrolase
VNSPLNILVVIASNSEYKLLAKYLETTPKTISSNKFKLFELINKNNHNKLTFLVTNIGVINATLTLSSYLENNNVDSLVNIGISGSYDLEKHPINSLCSIETDTFDEFGEKSSTSMQSLEEIKLSLNESALEYNQVTINNLSIDPSQILDMPVTKSIGNTVLGISSTKQVAHQRKNKWQASTESMECAAIIKTANYYNKPLSIIRAISNEAGDRNKKNWLVKPGLKSIAQLINQIYLLPSK